MRHWFLLILIFVASSWGRAHAAPAVDTHAVRALLVRLVGAHADQFELAALPASDLRERFRISATGNRIKVEGSSASALLFGLNWYLKYVAHVQISTNGSRLGDESVWPLPSAAIERDTPYAYRYALNENIDGYSAPYWDWSRWEHEIDVLALSGINAMIVERGMDAVLYQTFRDLGYSDAEMRAWITQPGHQNWQLMGNMCCFNGPISRQLIDRRAASARRIIGRLRQLGITPVLPGFYGIVPGNFSTKFPRAHVIEQGDWAGFTRPSWLDPRDPLFEKLASAFYRHQRALFGDSSIYDMEVFQEGGESGNVPVAQAAREVQRSLLRAHANARWMMLAWQGNPRQELLEGVDREHLLIIDIDHDRIARDDRATDFRGTPFLFGGIWEFGGRTTLGASVSNITERLQRLGRTNRNMAGTALFTEGLDTNPFAFDLFTEMAWRSEPLDMQAWTSEFVRRRYGSPDAHALEAWRLMLQTAYGIHVDAVEFNSERDAAQESLFDAQPDLSATSASHWSPQAMRYDAQMFRRVLPEMLQVSPALRGSATYRYDLVDIARQSLANESRILLPRIKASFDRRDRVGFHSAAQRWLQLMDLQDELLACNESFLVGRWLAQTTPWASTAEEKLRLDYDARSILTNWGDRKESQDASLHDYGNKDWAGLTHDYYRLRWKTYFDSLERELSSGTPAAPIDWFELGERWNRDPQVYPQEPQGDAVLVAARIATTLTDEEAAPVLLPADPSAR